MHYWDGCPTTRRSNSGYCVFLDNNLLSWSSKRQPTLSRSSTEAEYHGIVNGVAETCWVRNLLHELHTPLYYLRVGHVYYDNGCCWQVLVLHIAFHRYSVCRYFTPRRFAVNDLIRKNFAKRIPRFLSVRDDLPLQLRRSGSHVFIIVLTLGPQAQGLK
ncbi:ribonuclease H-like domain-containing protein [Tanacetum coccineum]